MPIFEFSNIDVTLVSGRRPDLLRATMHSFQERVFRNFRINNFRVNIDPFGGQERELVECRSIVRDHFPQAIISEPSQPSYGQAVKSLWSSVTSDFVLHLEDDWVALEPIAPERVGGLFHAGTACVKLNNAELRWDGRERRTRIEKVKFAGITVYYRRVPNFGVSPAFLTGEFVRGYSYLIDPNLDPEKQQRTHVNPSLAKYTSKFDCRVLAGLGQPEIIKDIGRDWREARGLEKVVSRGKSTWISSGSPSSIP
ncbi:hypothetical protein AB6802_03135 [Mesorhizobium sp. RCC_202]|uniref:hypothetical protein n=1 Tax=Mesorhizobium sp. RCC_202 TaxID=3239222 RepID=UPI0035255377